MFSAAQIRTVQGVLTQASSLAASRMNEINEQLRESPSLPSETVADLHYINVHSDPGGETRALFVSLHGDPQHFGHLIFADNALRPAALHLDLPPSRRYPTLMGLHYFIRRQPSVAYYFFSGALTTYENARFEYSRLKRRTNYYSQLSELLYTLNTPVANLPYPKGRKLSTLDAFKKMNIRYVGDLVRRSSEELEARLGKTGWITVRSILQGLRLQAGAPIPGWRSPK